MTLFLSPATSVKKSLHIATVYLLMLYVGTFFDEFVKTKQTKQNHCFVAVPVENAPLKCYIKEKENKKLRR